MLTESACSLALLDDRESTLDRAAPAPAAAHQFLQWLTTGRSLHPFRLSLCLVAAHPDDETLAIGAQLPRLDDLLLVHVTDGAPRNLLDANRAGFSTCATYAAARREELQRALQLVGRVNVRALEFEIPDQQTSFHLQDVTDRLLDLWRQEPPAVVLTHPYEGGHPDHDSTAFCVHAACHLLAREQRPAPSIVEFTSYHNNGGCMKTGDFLFPASTAAVRIPLPSTEQQFKRELLACFATQQLTLACFSIEAESFRIAPAYDFASPPHSGPLFYELFDWGMTGARWRALATEALQAFQLTGPL